MFKILQKEKKNPLLTTTLQLLALITVNFFLISVAYASINIKAVIRDGQTYFLGSHGTMMDIKMGRGDFPRNHYDIKNVDTTLFELIQNTNADFHIEKYNTISFNASLEFQSYNKATDQYEIKITLLPGSYLVSFDPTKPNASMELKNAKLVFADTQQPIKIIAGKLNRNFNSDGTPEIQKDLIDSFVLSLSSKRNELMLTTVKQISILVEENA